MSDLNADADAYLAKFDPAQVGENDPDKSGQAYLDRFDPSVVGQRPNPYDTLLDSIDPARNPGAFEGSRSAQSMQDEVDSMLDSIDPRVSGWGPPKGSQSQDQSSALGAFTRAAERSALPTAGGLAGAAAGAEAGGALGALAGPFGAGVGAFAGGVAGSFLGAGAVDAAQNWAISKLPTGVQSLLGGTQEQQKADWEEHGISALLGGVAPYALTMNPGFETRTLAPDATRLERLLNSKTGQAATGGLVMGGIALGQEASQGQLSQPRAWWNVAISTGLGMFLSRPNRLGETIMGAGAAPVRALVGRPQPTVAEAGDLKVAGPGITEDVYQGQEQMAPAAEQNVMETAQAERAISGEPPPASPDVHQVARRIAPDLFAHYDELAAKTNEVRDWISDAINPQEKMGALDQRYRELNGQLEAAGNEDDRNRIQAQIETEVGDEYARLQERQAAFQPGGVDSPELVMMRQRLAEADNQLREMTPQVAATYRRVAEATGGEMEPPAPQATAQPASTGAAPAPSREEMAANIAADVKSQLMRIGVSSAQAEARGQLEAAFFDTLAVRGNGVFGTARDLYNAHGPIWSTPEQNVVRRAPTQRPRSTAPVTLRAFLKGKGGVRDDFGDLKHMGLLREYPGLINSKGLSLDYAREAAAQAGYLGPVDQATANTTIADFLDALRQHPVYTLADRAEMAARDEANAADVEQERIDSARSMVDDFAKEHNLDLNGAVSDRATELLHAGEEKDPDAAIERAAIQLYNEDEESGRVPGSEGDQEENRGVAEAGARPGAAGAAAGAQEDLRRVGEAPPKWEGVDFSQGAKGKIHLAEGARPFIALFKDADFSTLIHEGAHNYLDILSQYAEHPEASPALRQDWQTIEDWLGVHEGGVIPTRAHEKFARGFEQYVREGVAPSRALARAFAQFRQWMLAIYQGVRHLGRPISDDIRSVFDRMLAEEPQPTVIAPETGQATSLAALHETDAVMTPPADAESAMDRVLSESDQSAKDLPTNVRDELESKLPAAEPRTEGREGALGPGHVGVDRGGPQPELGRGARGATAGEEPFGGGNARREGIGASAGVGAGEARADNARESAGNAFAPRSVPVWQRPESGLTDRAGNIVLKNLTPENFGQALVESAERNDDFKAFRGNMTKGQIWDVSTELGLNLEDVSLEDRLARVVGKFNNLAPVALALRRLTRESAKNVWQIASVAAKSQSDEDAAQLAAALSRHDMIQSALSGATASWGRTGNAFHSLRSFPQGVELDQVLKQTTGRTLYQTKMVAKMIAGLEGKSEADQTVAVSQLVKYSGQYSFGRMILEYWVNGLISGIPTHVTYSIGNTLSAATNVLLDTPAAAAIGALRKAAGRQGEVIPFGEMAARLAGGKRGLAPALTSALEATRTGVATTLPGQGPGMVPNLPGLSGHGAANLDEEATFVDAARALYALGRGLKDGVITGGAIATAGGPAFQREYSLRGSIPNFRVLGAQIPVGDLARLPGRMVAANHSFFTGLGYSIEINGQEYRQAWNEGHRGDALAERITQLRLNRDPEMMEKASKAALEGALMGPGGAFTRWISEGLSHPFNIPGLGEAPYLKFIAPFVHIGSNILNKAIVERTPVGILSKTVRDDLSGVNGTTAQDMAYARMAVGTVVAATFGWLAAERLMTGSGPTDPRQRARWLAAGYQPHSVLMDGQWIQLNRLGPIGLLMGMTADLYSAAHTASEGDLATGAGLLVHGIARDILDQSWLKGVSDIVSATEDDNKARSYVRNLASSFVPYSVGMSYTARTIDPYQRQARTVIDAIKAKIPWESETLLPRRDIWGQPIPNARDVTGTGLTAIWASKRSQDPVNIEMMRLGIAKAPVDRRIRNVTLTDQQYDDFQRIAGVMTKQNLDRFVRSGTYERMPDYARRDAIEAIIDGNREAARNQMMAKYPQIMRDATDRRRARSSGADIRAIGE